MRPILMTTISYNMIENRTKGGFHAKTGDYSSWWQVFKDGYE